MAVERRGAAIDIIGLRKEYSSGPDRVVALDDITLRIAPGEFVCIVGPSGCGKSTLLRILAGLTAQTGGTIKVEASGWAVENAMVFQESGLFPWMSVEANVGFGLMTRAIPTDEAAARVEAAVDSGTFTINGYVTNSAAPYGGVKGSGYGREHGVEGISEFLEYRTINDPRG